MIGATRLRLTQDIVRQQRLAAEIRRDQTEIVTERRIQAPSDDPVGSTAVATIVRRQADTESWQANVDRAGAMAADADTALSTIQNLLDGAASTLLAARNGLQSAEIRSFAATQLRTISAEIASLIQNRNPADERVFPDNAAIAIPVGDEQFIVPTMRSSEAFEVAGQSIVALLEDAAAAVMISDTGLRNTATTAALDKVNSAIAHVTEVRGVVGIAAENVERQREKLASASLVLIEQRNAIEGADIATVIARLQGRQVTLEAAQAVFSRINRQTLFDILR